MSDDEPDEIRRLRHKVARLRNVLVWALDNRNAYDNDFCRWCWKLGGQHNPGCWVERAEKVLKETGEWSG